MRSCSVPVKSLPDWYPMMKSVVIFLCLLLLGVESTLDQRYPFGYPLSSVEGTITCHCGEDKSGESKTFRLPRDTEHAWKILNGAMDYNICDQQKSSEICDYMRRCGSCYADIKRCYLNGIGIPNCVEKNDVLVMNAPNAPERNKTVKIFIPQLDQQGKLNTENKKKRSVGKTEEKYAIFEFKGPLYINIGKSCQIPYSIFDAEVHCVKTGKISECEIHCDPGFELPEGAATKIKCNESDGNNKWRPNGFERCTGINSALKGKSDARELNETAAVLNLLTNRPAESEWNVLSAYDDHDANFAAESGWDVQSVNDDRHANFAAESEWNVQSVYDDRHANFAAESRWNVQSVYDDRHDNFEAESKWNIQSMNDDRQANFEAESGRDVQSVNDDRHANFAGLESSAMLQAILKK